ncbi:hypothetical protein DFJ73DRAFT_827886 [Zopfochytrium polystomum]|nr:hypothetical protein DFJ73DRAFT_827886 [Zopfochytrium polystomum]
MAPTLQLILRSVGRLDRRPLGGTPPCGWFSAVTTPSAALAAAEAAASGASADDNVVDDVEAAAASRTPVGNKIGCPEQRRKADARSLARSRAVLSSWVIVGSECKEGGGKRVFEGRQALRKKGGVCSKGVVPVCGCAWWVRACRLASICICTPLVGFEHMFLLPGPSLTSSQV